MNEIMLGFDYLMLSQQGIKVPINVSIESHLIVVGGSGSGKSTSILFWLIKARKLRTVLFICDFKKSKEFSGISRYYGEFEECYELIKSFNEVFLQTPEGGDGYVKILLIDEIAGLLNYLAISKEGVAKSTKSAAVEEIKGIMMAILMLGRSRKCFLWLSMQRYTASIFPSASGSADNFHICVGLGRLTVEGRKGLFGGEHFNGEEDMLFGQGKGIVLIDGEPLKSLIIPRVSKQRMLEVLQNRW